MADPSRRHQHAGWDWIASPSWLRDETRWYRQQSGFPSGRAGL